MRRDLQAPARQVLHGRLIQQVGEALRQRRARQAYLACEFVHGPGMGRLAVITVVFLSPGTENGFYKQAR